MELAEAMMKRCWSSSQGLSQLVGHRAACTDHSSTEPTVAFLELHDGPSDHIAIWMRARVCVDGSR